MLIDLYKLFISAQKIAQVQLKNSIEMVDYIINNRITDKRIIESVFDQLLDSTYILGDETRNIYYKLLDYYKMIDVEASSDYEKFYLEIINEDEKKLKKRINNF